MADTDTQRGFWRPGTVAAGVILLLVVLAGVVLVIVHTGRGGGGKASTAPRPPAVTTPSSTAMSASPTAAGSGCSVPAGSQAVPDVTPPGISWNLYQTVALPSSTTAGPTKVAGDVARCYAHSPLGALLAASQIQYRYLIAPDWKSVLAAQVVDNPGRAAYSKVRAANGNPGGNQPGDYDQLAGFKFVTYSPTQAVIEFVLKSSAGAMQAGTTTVNYVGGDWKLQLQPDGSDSPTLLPVASLVGYSVWAGV